MSGREGWPEETEVPLMSLMFLAMVFHAQRRLQAMAVAESLAKENAPRSSVRRSSSRTSRTRC